MSCFKDTAVDKVFNTEDKSNESNFKQNKNPNDTIRQYFHGTVLYFKTSEMNNDQQSYFDQCFKSECQFHRGWNMFFKIKCIIRKTYR